MRSAPHAVLFVPRRGQQPERPGAFVPRRSSCFHACEVERRARSFAPGRLGANGLARAKQVAPRRSQALPGARDPVRANQVGGPGVLVGPRAHGTPCACEAPPGALSRTAAHDQQHQTATSRAPRATAAAGPRAPSRGRAGGPKARVGRTRVRISTYIIVLLLVSAFA